MKCKSCNNEVSNGTRICPFCGNKLSNSKKVLVILAIVVTLIITISVGAMGVLSELYSPKNVFSKAIDMAFAYNDMENINTISTDINISVEKTAKVDEEYENIAGLNLNMNLGTDISKNSNLLKLQLNQNKDELIKLDALIKENKAYLYNENYYKYPIKFDLSEMSDEYNQYNNGIQITDMDKASSILKEEIKGQINELDLSSEETTINKDNQDIKTTKYIMKLNTNDVMNKTQNILEKLISNEEFLNCFNNQTSIKNTLNAALNNISDQNCDLDDIEVLLYCSGFKRQFERLEISYTNDDETYKVQLDRVDDTNYKLKVYEDTTEIVISTINVNGKNNYSAKVNLSYIPNLCFVVNVSNTYNSNINYTFSESNAVSFDEIGYEEVFEILGEIKLYDYFQEYLVDNFFDIDVDEDDIDEEDIEDADSNINVEKGELILDNIRATYNVPTDFSESEDNNNTACKYYVDFFGDKIKTEIVKLSQDEYEEKIGMEYEKYENDEKYKDIRFDVYSGTSKGKNYKKYLLDYTEVEDEIEYKSEYISMKIDDEHCFIIESEDMDEIYESDLLVIIESVVFN